MDKRLKEKLSERISQLKAISKDAHFAEKLIDDILSLKGQIDVEPTELYVRCSDVVRVYNDDSQAYRIKRCKNGILFEAIGTMSTFIPVSHSTLYQVLNQVLNEVDARDTFDADGKANIDIAFSTWMLMLQSPVGASVAPEVLTEMTNHYLGILLPYLDSLMKQPLAEETETDLLQNDEDAQTAKVLDAMSESIKEDSNGTISKDKGVSKEKTGDKQ